MVGFCALNKCTYMYAPLHVHAHTYTYTCIYILLTKREGHTGRISAQGLDSTDRAQRGPYKKDRGLIFSRYGPKQAWLIRDLLYD